MAVLGHDVIGIDVDPAAGGGSPAGGRRSSSPSCEKLLGEAARVGPAAVLDRHAAAAGATRALRLRRHAAEAGRDKADLHLRRRRPSTRCSPSCEPGDVVVGKSTVPVGTAERLAAKVSAPSRQPRWRGTRSSCARATRSRTPSSPTGSSRRAGRARRRRRARVLHQVYAARSPTAAPLVVTDYPTAQLVKVAANSFLATKISFINAMAELCEATGGDVSRWPTRSVTTPGSAGSSSTPASASAVAACPRTSARSWPAPASSASTTLTFLQGGRLDQPAAPRADGRPGPRGARRRLAAAARRPRRRVQAGQRRRPRLPGPQRRRPPVRQGAEVVVTDPQAIDNARAGGRTSSSPTPSRRPPPTPSSCCC